VMNHRNGLTVASPSRKSVTNHCAVDLARRFSFQPYSESTDDDIVHTSTNRCALLDKRLLEEVYERIAMQTHLETRSLLLQAHNGVVTIEGCVSDRAMRAQIGSFIRHCSFVKNVVNRMRTHDADSDQGTVGNHSRTRAIAA